MNLCEYGCGQKAIYQFKNGKWCCNKYPSKCLVIREKNKLKNIGRIVTIDTKEKIRKSNLGLKRNIKTCKKISNSCKGRVPWNKGKTNVYSKESLELIRKNTKIGMSKINVWNKGKTDCFSADSIKKMKNSSKKENLSDETLYKMKISSRITIEQIKGKHPTFFKVEQMRYKPGKEKERIIQVHCKNHNCRNSKEQGGWFTPTKSQISERIRQIEKDFGNDGAYFYCSDNCKQECPLYYNKGLYSKSTKEELYTTEEYQIFREEVLSRSENKCEYCGQKASHVHHSRPQKLEPGFALDPDFGVACCKECHYKYGHKKGTECSTSNLANKICNK